VGHSLSPIFGNTVTIMVISWSIEDIGITVNFLSGPNCHGWILSSLYQVVQLWPAGFLEKGSYVITRVSVRTWTDRFYYSSHAKPRMGKKYWKDSFRGLKLDVEGNRRIENLARIDKIYKMVGFSPFHRQIKSQWQWTGLESNKPQILLKHTLFFLYSPPNWSNIIKSRWL
jgi:hypothetical protein